MKRLSRGRACGKPIGWNGSGSDTVVALRTWTARDIPSLPFMRFPTKDLQVLYVRLTNSFETVSLDQLDDLEKTGLHIRRQRFELISNAIIEQFENPSHAG